MVLLKRVAEKDYEKILFSFRLPLPMNEKLEKYWHIPFILIAIIVSLYLRIVNPWNVVFVSWIDGARLSGNDPWYYFRLIESAVHNFPNRLWFDAFTKYPFGTYLHFGPFMVYLGAIISIISGASTPEQIRNIIVFIPAIGGSLLAIPVYILAKEIFGKKAGVIAAFLVVLIPGQLMARSVLSFNDHHIWEVFWQTMTIALFAASINAWNGRSAQENLKNKKNLLYPVLTGISLGLYLDTWAPGFVISLMILTYVFLIYITEFFWKSNETVPNVKRKKEKVEDTVDDVKLDYAGDNISYISGITFLVGALVYLPFAFIFPGLSTTKYSPFQFIVLIGASVIVFLFKIIKSFKDMGYFKRFGDKQDTVFSVSIILVVLVLVGVIALTSDFFILFGRIIRTVQPKGGALTVAEVQPFFTLGGKFSLSPAWQNFSMAFFFAIPGMIYTAIKLVKERKNVLLLSLIWGVALFIALAGQNRFAYYFGVVSAVFAAAMLEYFMKLYINYFSERRFSRVYMLTILWFIAFVILFLNTEYFFFSLLILTPALVDAFLGLNIYATRKYPDLNRLREILRKNKTSTIYAVILLLLSTLVLVYPMFNAANTYSRYSAGGINKHWYDTLVWMNENTPGKEMYDEFYYQIYKPPDNPKERYPYYPDGVYSIISWWDYGHWITAIAHRIPVANPFQQGIGNKYNDVPGAAPFFTAFNESYANRIADFFDVKYVVSDVEMATGKFYAMAVWAEGNLEKAGQMYYAGAGIVYVDPTGNLALSLTGRLPLGAKQLATINIPSIHYYQTMEAKFHIFDGSGLKHYRMVYESGYSTNTYSGFQEVMFRKIYNSLYSKSLGYEKVPEVYTGYVKVFEYVKGAVVKGKANGDEVIAKVTIKTNQGRTFQYVQKAKVVNGEYELILPYAQNTDYPVKPISEYTIESGGVSKTLVIDEDQVEKGETINLDLV